MDKRSYRLLAWLFPIAVVLLVPIAALVTGTAGAAVSTGARISTYLAAQADPQQQVSSREPPFDCSQISALGIDKQMNMHAAEILARCGKNSAIPNSSGSHLSNPLQAAIGKLLAPFYGGADANVILPDGAYPHVTQSEGASSVHGSTVVVNYNDSRSAPGCYSGTAYSTDGGVTFEHTGQPLCTGHGTNYGVPALVYYAAQSIWLAGDVATGCGGQGIGTWSSNDGAAWYGAACAHIGTNDDRESIWADNNPSSPHYGRIYVSFNNFNVNGGALQVVYSDDSFIWSNPVTVNPTFFRDVQITGDLQGSGSVYIAAMDEQGGGLTYRTNHMFRSTDGGATWADSVMGAPFRAPGRSSSGYFGLMFTQHWRYMGAGEPAAVGTDVHYVFTECGQPVMCASATDYGDVYYQRSTDAGVTWAAPIKLNTDTGAAMQWQPSLAATSAGGVYAGWYDERDANGGADLDCTAGNPAQGCYERYGRVSLDHGATWQADAAVGDVMSPLPAQPDPNVQPTNEGDYNSITSDGDVVYDQWTDGRVAINSTSQQDIFLDRINVPAGTPTPTATGTPPTNTPTRTRTRTPTVTVPPVDCNNIQNGGFETGSFPPWVILDTNPTPVVSNMDYHSGVYSALLGALSGSEPLGDSAIYQQYTVPAGGGMLSYWWNGATTDSITFDWQDAYITDTSGNILATIMHTCQTTGGWVQQTFNLAPFAGQAIRIEFLVHEDGYGDDTSMYVDDVTTLLTCASPTPTHTGTPPTNTRTNTPTNARTPTSTPTPTVTGTPPTHTPSPTPCFIPDIIQNGGFESGSLSPGWAIVPGDVNPTPTVTSDYSHSGTHSVLLGTLYGPEPNGDSAIYQQITVPPNGGTLSYWWDGSTVDEIAFDRQEAFITDTSGNILATIMYHCETTGGWVNQTFNLAPFAGQTVRVEFLVYEDGFGDITSMYVDDVAIFAPICASPTPTNMPTSTRTYTPTETDTPTSTGTSVVSATSTSTHTPTSMLTPTEIPTDTAVPTGSGTPVPPTPTACSIQFSDVPVGSTFYPYVHCLACLGIINGYPDGTFKPNNQVTRGQLSKIVSNSAGFHDAQPAQMFQDVPLGSTFQVYVGRLASRGYISGYPCGNPEPCVPPGNLPYFRPNNNATRGQISKIDANAASFNDPPTGQQFQDVAVGSTYYTYTFRLVSRGVMSGYQCGGAGEPCVPPNNLPYFRPNSNATRGQTSKIVSNTFFPDCNPPVR